MSDVYLYAFSDTANGQVNDSILRQEILDAGTIPGLEYVSALWGPKTIEIQFVAALSGSELTALDAVVAAHVGLDFSAREQTFADPSTQDTSGSNPLSALSTGGMGPALPTEYRIYFYCEHRLQSAAPGGVSTVRLKVDGVEQAVDVLLDVADWRAFSAILELVCDAGDDPAIIVELEQSGAASTAEIRRIQLDFEVVEG